MQKAENLQKEKPVRFHLPYPLYDSHFHALQGVAKLLSAAFLSGLCGAVEVAVDEHHFDRRLEFTKLYPQLNLSAGIHPSSSGVENGNLRSRFTMVREQAAHPSVVAIGESGLDFYRDYAPQDRQEEAFRYHLELAVETGLPIIIHNRAADDRVLAILRESGCRCGVFHCFSSGWETAVQALDLGFHISFAGNLTYRKTEEIREAAAGIPSDRLLVETDAPYLSPQPVRGQMNHPGHIGYTLEALAEIRHDDPEELAKIMVKNSIELFGIKPEVARGQSTISMAD